MSVERDDIYTCAMRICPVPYANTSFGFIRVYLMFNKLVKITINVKAGLN